MMIINRHGSAEWGGSFRTGHGHITTESGALANYPYRYASRFEGLQGSNPEELLGAALAACFTMALSRALEKDGYVADVLSTTAEVKLEASNGSYQIPAIALKLAGRVPGLSDDQLAAYARATKDHCPVSKALAAIEITLSELA